MTEPPGFAWEGPRASLGVAGYVLQDGYGGGFVRALTLGGCLRVRPIRFGILAEGGLRDYSLGDSDVVLRAAGLVAYEWLAPRARWASYAGLTGSGGVLAGKRFHHTVSDFLYGGGVEAGFDVRFVRSLHLGLGLGWELVSVDRTAGSTIVVRIRVGL